MLSGWLGALRPRDLSVCVWGGGGCGPGTWGRARPPLRLGGASAALQGGMIAQSPEQQQLQQ